MRSSDWPRRDLVKYADVHNNMKHMYLRIHYSFTQNNLLLTFTGGKVGQRSAEGLKSKQVRRASVIVAIVAVRSTPRSQFSAKQPQLSASSEPFDPGRQCNVSVNGWSEASPGGCGWERGERSVERPAVVLLHPYPAEAPLKGRGCSGEQVLANTLVKLRTSAPAGAGLQGESPFLSSKTKGTTR